MRPKRTTVETSKIPAESNICELKQVKEGSAFLLLNGDSHTLYVRPMFARFSDMTVRMRADECLVMRLVDCALMGFYHDTKVQVVEKVNIHFTE